MKELYPLSPKTTHIIKTKYYRFGCNGNRSLLACLTRLIALGYQLDCGNYSLLQAVKINKNKAKSSDSAEIKSLYALQNCIIAYCGCYDTILQIVYFGLGLSTTLHTKDDFLNAIKQCKWRSNDKTVIGIEDKLKQMPYNETIFELSEKLRILFDDRHRGKVASYANSLKHGGGLLTRNFMHYISDISFVNEEVEIHINKDGTVKFNCPEKVTLFNAEWLYPKAVDIDVAIQQMYKQNEYIYMFVDYFLSIMGFNQIDKLNPDEKYTIPFLNNREPIR